MARQGISAAQGDAAAADSARVDYLAAARLDPELAGPALNNAGRLAQERGRIAEALELYRGAILYPHPLRALFLVNLGGAFEQAGFPDSAFSMYGAAVEEDSTSPAPTHALLDAAVRHRPDEVPALARAAAARGFTSQASGALERLLVDAAVTVTDATAEQALVALAELLAARNDAGETAGPALERIGARHPALSVATANLARALAPADGAPPADTSGWWYGELHRFRVFSELLRRRGDRALSAGRREEAGRFYAAALGPVRFDAAWRNDNAWLPALALAEGDGPAVQALAQRLEHARGATRDGEPGSFRGVESVLAGIAQRRGEHATALTYAQRVAAASDSLRARGPPVLDSPEVVAVLVLEATVTGLPVAGSTSAGASVAQLLSGRSAAVTVSEPSGAPGSEAVITLRGKGDLGVPGGVPLMVIDGVPARTGGRSAGVNPLDVATIETLPASAALAVYGADAAAGAILVTTKHGYISGRPRFSLGIEQGAAWFADAEDRIDGSWGMHADSSVFLLDLFQTERERGNRIFRNGAQQGYDASVSGGSRRLTYYASGTWSRREGIERPSASTDRSGRINLELVPRPDWRIAARLGYTARDAVLPCEAECNGLLHSTVIADPASLQTPRRGFRVGPPEVLRGRPAPSWLTRRAMAHATLEGPLLPAVRASLRLGWDHAREDSRKLQPIAGAFLNTIDAAAGAPVPWGEWTETDLLALDGSLVARSEPFAGVDATTTLGAGYLRARADFRAGFLLDPASPFFGAALPFGNRASPARRERSLYAQQELSLRDRLVATGSLRGDDRGGGWHPGLALAWTPGPGSLAIGRAVELLELSAAYGAAGGRPDPLLLLRAYSPGVSGVYRPPLLGDAARRPARTAELEAGAELSFWEGTLSVTATAYTRTTRDGLLFRPQPPSSTGYGGVQAVNLGGVRARGVELRVESLPARVGRLDVSLRATLATHRDRVTALGDADNGRGFAGVGGQRWVPGFPYAAWFERRVVSARDSAGVVEAFCDGGDPNGRLLPDGTPLEAGGAPVPCYRAPPLYLGPSTPTRTGSLQARVAFGGVQLGALVEWRAGYLKLDESLRQRCQAFRVCEENFFPERFPATRIAQVQSGGFLREFAINDAGFARLREVSLGYALPGRWAARFGARTMSVAVTGRNLGLWTGWTGLDPETEVTGSLLRPVELPITPPLAHFQVKLDVTF